uniref:Uncharacterized protein n=1 Tax=Anguilla anguilla TaxID=7936 RepID=A0A0E9PLN1_ANGAN
MESNLFHFSQTGNTWPKMSIMTAEVR